MSYRTIIRRFKNIEQRIGALEIIAKDVHEYVTGANKILGFTKRHWKRLLYFFLGALAMGGVNQGWLDLLRSLFVP